MGHMRTGIEIVNPSKRAVEYSRGKSTSSKRRKKKSEEAAIKGL